MSRSRRRTAILAAFLAASAAGAQANLSQPAPRIVCDEPVLDLGRRPPSDERIAHAFEIRNDGDLTLEILGIREFCGCTGVRIGTRRLAPGARTHLHATFSLQGRRGEVAQAIVVQSNDPVTPQLRLTFAVHIEPEILFRPMSFLLGEIARHEAVTAHADAVFPDHRPGRILEAFSDSPFFIAAFEEIEPGKVYRIRVRSQPPLDGPTSSLRANVRVRTDVRGSEEWRLPIVATRIDPIMIAPDAIVLQAGEDMPIARFVTVRGAPGVRFRIAAVEAPPPVRYAVDDAGERGYRIRLEIDGPTAALDGQQLRIHTDPPDWGTPAVPFRVLSGRRRGR